MQDWWLDCQKDRSTPMSPNHLEINQWLSTRYAQNYARDSGEAMFVTTDMKNPVAGVLSTNDTNPFYNARHQITLKQWTRETYDGQKFIVSRCRASRWVRILLEDTWVWWKSLPANLVGTGVREKACASRIPLCEKISSQSGISTNFFEHGSRIDEPVIGQERMVRKILANVSKIKNGSDIQRRKQRRVANTAQL